MGSVAIPKSTQYSTTISSVVMQERAAFYREMAISMYPVSMTRIATREAKCFPIAV